MELSAASSTVQQDTCEDCGATVLGVVTLIKDDLRQGLPAPHADFVFLTPGYPPARPTFDARFGRDPQRQRSLQNQALPAVLRI